MSAKGSKVILTQVPKPIPALNYASDAFYGETALWYDAICAVLAKHAYPNGGIVAAQVDNEMAYFFGVNAYIADYSAKSLAAYRQFLLGKYGGLDALGSAYSAPTPMRPRSSHRGGSPPPTRRTFPGTRTGPSTASTT